jgi:hypothetical protein
MLSQFLFDKVHDKLRAMITPLPKQATIDQNTHNFYIMILRMVNRMLYKLDGWKVALLHGITDSKENFLSYSLPIHSLLQEE